MKKNYTKRNFLAKWAEGTLTDSELEEFRKTKDYKVFSALLEATEALKVPDFDKKGNLQKIQEKIDGETQVISLFPKWAKYAAAAACLVGFMSIFHIFYGRTTYQTDFGQQMVVELPDGSSVNLNAASKLSFKKYDWKENRNIALEGEAFIKVKKGSTFDVFTDKGSVKVLGTEFKVLADQEFFEVVCYEGVVEVSTENTSKILEKGDAIRFLGSQQEIYTTPHRSPTWSQQNESSFVNAPIGQVINSLEAQFDVTIDRAQIKRDPRFTGRFTHTNLETALKTVFHPLEIRFTFTEKKSVVVLREM